MFCFVPIKFFCIVLYCNCSECSKKKGYIVVHGSTVIMSLEVLFFDFTERNNLSSLTLWLTYESERFTLILCCGHGFSGQFPLGHYGIVFSMWIYIERTFDGRPTFRINIHSVRA